MAHRSYPEVFYERTLCGRHLADGGRFNTPLIFCSKHFRHYCPKCGSC